MSEVLTFKCYIDVESLEQKIQDLINDSTMLEVHNLFAKTIDPWTPFLEGNLSQQIEITPKYVRYTVPYAHYQYYGVDFNHTVTHHPLASAKWDEAAMQVKKDSFVHDVQEILERRARELNGGG